MKEETKVWIVWGNSTRTLTYLSCLARYEALYGAPHPFTTEPYENHEQEPHPRPLEG